MKKLYLATSAAAAEKLTIGYDPVNARFADPITTSPRATPVIANVPVEFDVAVVIVPRVTAPIIVDPYDDLIMLGPLAPILIVPAVILFEIVESVTV